MLLARFEAVCARRRRAEVRYLRILWALQGLFGALVLGGCGYVWTGQQPVALAWIGLLCNGVYFGLNLGRLKQAIQKWHEQREWERVARGMAEQLETDGKWSYCHPAVAVRFLQAKPPR